MLDSNLSVDLLNPQMDRLFTNTAFLTAHRIRAVKEHLYSDLKDEAVILNMENGKYYGLNLVGVSIWKAIQEPATIDEIESAVMQEYDVDRETCHNEIASFVRVMAVEKLIEIVDEESS